MKCKICGGNATQAIVCNECLMKMAQNSGGKKQ